MNLPNPLYVARELLDCHYILGFPCNSCEKLWSQIDFRIEWIVVGDDRNADFRDFLKMCHHFIIICSISIWRKQHDGCSTEGCSMFGPSARFGGPVGANSGNDREPFWCRRNRRGHHLTALLGSQNLVLTK